MWERCVGRLPVPGKSMSCGYAIGVLHSAGMSETLTIRLGEQLARALREEARQSGLPRGEIARQALEARLHSGTKLRTMRRFIGAARGPSDLSSNRQYRRTWGKRSS